MPNNGPVGVTIISSAPFRSKGTLRDQSEMTNQQVPSADSSFQRSFFINEEVQQN